MPYHHCSSPGCGLRTVGYSSLCRNHARTKARHGHPRQRGITLGDITPYLRVVDARRKASPNSPAWAILADRWSRLLAQSQRVVDQYLSGHAVVRHERQAAQTILTLAGEVGADKVISTVMAVYMLQEAEPRRVLTDQAFDFQLVRRVRFLASVAVASYWDHKTRKKRQVYRDFPPRAVGVMAGHLKEAFGFAALQFAKNEAGRVQAAEWKRQREREALREAVEALSHPAGARQGHHP
jgi:hypothetical protein